jgi:hypothetical protein
MWPSRAGAETKSNLAFGSALTGPAVVTAVLFVAGFSYEWAFYYNFGLEHLARQLPALSTAIAAFEIVRDFSDAFYAIALIVIPQFLLGLVSRFGERFSMSTVPALRTPAVAVATVLDAGDGLVRNAIAAFLLVDAAAFAGAYAGTHAYRTLAIEDRNALPRVTLLFTNGEMPIACEQHDGLSAPPAAAKPNALIGSPYPLAELRGGRACNLPGQTSWRLLYRDDKFVYVFQTLRSTDSGRPLTLVVPTSDKLILILNGAEGDV